MITTATDVEKARGFIQGLEQAEGIYRRLIGLTKNQSEVLRGGISPQLLDLARAKEAELDRLNDLEKTLAPARSSWLELRERLAPDVKSEVQVVVSRVEGVLRELLAIEEEEGKRLQTRRDEIVAEIRRLDSARKMRGAYAGTPRPRSLLDQKE